MKPVMWMAAFASLVSTSAMTVPVLAQQRPVVPPGATQVRPALPSRVPTQPIRPEDRLRLALPQSNLPVERFAHFDLRCSANLNEATSQIDARLLVPPSLVVPARVRVEVLVDGVSAGSEDLAVRDGGVVVSRRVNLRGGRGDHQVVFVLDGRARSEAQGFSHACVTGTSARLEAPGQLTLPNLAFGNLLYAELAPAAAPQPSNNNPFAERRVSLGCEGCALMRPIIVRDVRNATGPVQFPANTYCPDERDAYVSARFALAINAERVADPTALVEVRAGPVATRVSYVDTLDGPRLATGGVPNDRTTGTPLPQGHQWLVFVAALQCTRNGVMEVHFDPGNSLRESNEADNVIRIRYSTVGR